jgi:hypothetical protein
MDERRLKTLSPLNKKPSSPPSRREPARVKFTDSYPIAESDGSARPGLTGAPTVFPDYFLRRLPDRNPNPGEIEAGTAKRDTETEFEADPLHANIDLNHLLS